VLSPREGEGLQCPRGLSRSCVDGRQEVVEDCFLGKADELGVLWMHLEQARCDESVDHRSRRCLRVEPRSTIEVVYGQPTSAALVQPSRGPLQRVGQLPGREPFGRVFFSGKARDDPLTNDGSSAGQIGTSARGGEGQVSVERERMG